MPKLLLLLFVLLAALLPALPYRQAVRQAQSLGPGRRLTTLERLQPAHLAAVRRDRLRYQAARRSVALKTGYDDLRAVLHAHAEDSAHTGGTRHELLAAAKRTGVRIVMLTDHIRPPRDFINDSWRGLRDGVLFIPGAEGEGFLAYPRHSIIAAHASRSFKTATEYEQIVRATGGEIFLSHLEEHLTYPTGRLTGVEIYNNHADFIDEAEFVRWLRGAFTDAERLRQIERLLTDYPMEVFGSVQDYLPLYLAKWDRDSAAHRLTGVAANDCHHNQVYTVRAVASDAIEVSLLGDPPRRINVAQAPSIAELLRGKQAGEVIARLDFDPYERSLSFVTTHILARALHEQAVRQALRQAHAYVAHDWLCDPTGFAFVAESGTRRAGVMGDEVRWDAHLRLRVAAPVTATIKLLCNGEQIAQAEASSFDFAVREPGVYRAELWLEVDGEMRPWIYANAIRVVAR